jgi:glycosyltransferase involved in cell wall biosynthesis
MLRRTLYSLLGQTRAPTEILVIDNAPSDDATQDMVLNEFEGVRYVREEIVGLDFARNRALKESRSPIVAFTDDDVVVADGWIAELQHAFLSDPKLVVCTGKVDPLVQDTDGQRLFEANAGFSRGTQAIQLPHGRPRSFGFRAPLITWIVRIGAGCSLAVRRDPVLAIGGFDEAMDLGIVLPAGGDHDLIWRVLLAKGEIRYEPRVHAKHEHRREMAAAIQQIINHNKGTVTMVLRAAALCPWWQRPSVWTYLTWRLLKPGSRLLLRAFGNDPLPAAALLRLWSESWRGLTAYPAALREAEERRAAVINFHRACNKEMGNARTPVNPKAIKRSHKNE